MSKLYVASNNWCRGDEWTEKYSFPLEQIKPFLYKLAQLKDEGVDWFDEEIEEEQGKVMIKYGYKEYDCILTSLFDTDFTEREGSFKGFVDEMLSEGVLVELEESNIGAGISKQIVLSQLSKIDVDRDW